MNLPFSAAEFWANFAVYNRSVWPAQIGLLALGVIVAIHSRSSHPDRRVLGGGLAALWLWMGAVYHLAFFTDINPAAFLFAAAFVLQAVLLVAWGLQGPALGGQPGRVIRPVSAALLGYALVIYPVLATIAGHRYPAMPTFGLPCPTTIATLGVLVLVTPPPPWWLLVIPVGWAVIGASAAFTMGVYEDLGLIVAAVLAVLNRFTARVNAPEGRVELTAQKF